MKTFIILLSTILIMGLNLSFAQTARFQIIHNSADASSGGSRCMVERNQAYREL